MSAFMGFSTAELARPKSAVDPTGGSTAILAVGPTGILPVDFGSETTAKEMVTLSACDFSDPRKQEA